jgi:predicted branched-subunit amino acid permease
VKNLYNKNDIDEFNVVAKQHRKSRKSFSQHLLNINWSSQILSAAVKILWIFSYADQYFPISINEKKSFICKEKYFSYMENIYLIWKIFCLIG